METTKLFEALPDRAVEGHQWIFVYMAGGGASSEHKLAKGKVRRKERAGDLRVWEFLGCAQTALYFSSPVELISTYLRTYLYQHS